MKYKDNFTPEQRANYWEYMYKDAIKKSDMWRIRYEHLLAEHVVKIKQEA